MSGRSRQWLTIVSACGAGVLVLSAYAVPSIAADVLLASVALVLAAALLAGIGHAATAQVRRIRHRESRPEAIATLTGIVAAFSLALLAWFALPGAAVANSGFVVYVYRPLATTLLALLAFFALAAVWRGFSLRPADTSMIVGVAAIWLFARGPWASTQPLVATILRWLEAYPVLGVTRGIVLGAAMGALIASARVLFGIDQPYLDR